MASSKTVNPIRKKRTMSSTHSLGPVSQLKIDKDCHVDKSWISDYVERMRSDCRSHGVRVLSIRMSRTKKGQHYYVDIHPAVSSEKANRLQWLLGDDCLRVDYNRARIESSLDDWNKLFERIGQRYETLYGKVPAGTRKTTKGGIRRNG